MKTDSQLQEDVMAELEWEPSLDHAHIGVAANDGVVALSGFVRSYAEKLAVEKATRRVAGVRAIAEEIEVRHDADSKTSDPEIARRILDIFAWDALIPEDAIDVKVEHGVVTLTGTAIWHYQRDAAKNAASKIGGVKGVSDLIEVRNVPVARDVRETILAALKRAASLDAASIIVIAEGGTVRLGGKVHAWHERQVAERAAWAAPGVTEVIDNIVVV